MAFLHIDGVGDIEVQTTNPSVEYEEIGSTRRAYSGNLRSSIKAVRRKWSFTSAPVSQTTYENLYNATKLGQNVVCSGDALNASITCQVKVTADYIPNGLNFSMIMALELTEI